MDREKRRLLRLEEEAANRRRPPLVGRKEVDEDLEWAQELARRCEESGMEDWEIIKDMCDFVDSLGLPLDQIMAAFDDYPGPYHWGGRGC